MTEIEKKALALVNEVRAEYPLVSSEVASNLALCRAIEQHESYKQEVSEEVKAALACGDCERLRREGILSRFIIAKPDPLVEAMQEWWDADGYADIETFRAAIEKRGGKIVWGEGA